MFAFSINLLYLLTSAYTLVWIAFKRCRKLSSHLTIYSKMCRERETKTVAKKGGGDEEEIEMERKIDVFGGLNSPDVELLLDLLAETMGMAPAMRIMTMLDPELLKSWRVKRRTEVRQAGSQIPVLSFVFPLTDPLQHDRIASTSAALSFRTCEMVRYMRTENQRKVKYLVAVEPPIDDEEEGQLRMFFHTPTYRYGGRGGGKEAPESDDNVNVFLLRYDGMKGRGPQSHLGRDGQGV